MMHRILHLAIHDTKLFVMAKESIFFMFVMPVMFMLFFSSVLGGSGDEPETVTISLQVMNEDDGFMATAFMSQLEGESFEVELVKSAEVDSAAYIRRLTIPEDFTALILAGEQAELGLTKNADSNVQYDIATQVRLHKAQVAFLGNVTRWSPPAQEDGALPPISDADKGRLMAMIDEDSNVRVESQYAGRGRPVPSGAAQSIPGMLTMFVVMTMLIGGSESLTREKHEGTLQRLATTTYSRQEILTGKLLHLALVGVVQALVLMAAGQAIGELHLFGIDFTWGSGAGSVALLSIPFAIAMAGITLFVSGLFRSTQQAESLSWLVGMGMAALGGCWWPMEIVPKFGQILGRFFPTYWAMDGLHAVITFGRGIEAILLPSIVLLGFGVLFGWIGTKTMRIAQPG